MLTAVELQNFKGFAARQRVDLAPITLLFGANSAGKSTILDALLYLNELVHRGAADVDRTELGGHAVELGGFARLVHRHEREREMYIRVEFPTRGTLERFGRPPKEVAFPDLDDAVDDAWLEVVVRERAAAAFQGAVVDRVLVGVGAERVPLVSLELGETLREGEPLRARVNFDHPVLGRRAAKIRKRWAVLAAAEGDVFDGDDGDLGESSTLRGAEWPVFALARSRMSALPSPFEPLRVVSWAEDDSSEHAGSLREARTFLEMVVCGTITQLATTLRHMWYVGPLRAVPPRGLLYERAASTSTWADGLAAWDLLLADRETLVIIVNEWLERLAVGCQVVVQELFDLNASAEEQGDRHTDQTTRRLLLGTGAGGLVLPTEVGAGVSQLMPVLVAALADGPRRLVAVEQPELHVHPAVQVGLGDLLIRASETRWFLIETHSEHLVLRLLRRIQETSEGQLSDKANALSPEKLSIVRVASSADGVTTDRFPVDTQGELTKPWPGGFFEERAKELF